MDIQKYVNATQNIDSNREYWFVRTEGGKYYDIFVEKGFVAIGWNDITIDEIAKSIESKEFLRNKLAVISEREEKKRAKADKDEINYNNIIDLKTSSGKSKSSMIINKLLNFYNLKKGDVIVIPDDGSSNFSFGIIDDERIYNGKPDGCEFIKRRKIKWITHKDFDSLDTIFFTLKKSMHAISSVKFDLAEHIDRVMNDLYYKDGYGHYVIRVKKKEDISATDLFGLGNDLINLLQIINEKYSFNEEIEGTIVKINVQSNGDFLLKGKIGKSIISLGLLVNLAACSQDKSQNIDEGSKQLLEDIQTNKNAKKLFEGIKSKIDSLEIDVNTRQNNIKL